MSEPLIPDRLRADCSNCCGLCCVALPFDAIQGFGFDKAAHEPCSNLQPDNRCAIHSRLAANGFPGCALFECFGAGQWVTQRLFNGQTWQDCPVIAEQMFNSFRRILALHELMAKLTIAISLANDAQLQESMRSMRTDLELLCSEGRTVEVTMIAIVTGRAKQLLRQFSATSARRASS
jgi:hypothetical protein